MKIPVALERAPYEVTLGTDVRHEIGAFIAGQLPKASAVAIITSAEIVAQPWFDFDFGVTTHVFEVADGEMAKTLEVTGALCEQLARHQFSRHDVIVGIGGGAITDLAGFVAAVYLRGVAVVQVPTSLVGQVDAAIGGKTAVNLAAGKNLVGAFHQPRAVFCDARTLETLPQRELHSGYGEIAKCWLLEGHGLDGLAEARLEDLVALSVALKARIVAADEFEGGLRALLNYGHTLGHAVELLALERDPDELRHGEAVAVGLAFAVRLARALGRAGDDDVATHDAVLAHFGLRWGLADHFSTDDLIGAMARDKKAHHNLTFVLPGPDGFTTVANVDEATVRAVLDEFRGA